MQFVPDFLEKWLKDFSAAVRKQDFVSGKNLFEDGIVSFGTVCFRADTLDELASHQWQRVWPKTKKFEFDYKTARAVVADSLATIVTAWSSTGFDRSGFPFERRGRATIVLQKSAGDWKAVHTHFSLEPMQKNDLLCRSLSGHDQKLH